MMIIWVRVDNRMGTKHPLFLLNTGAGEVLGATVWTDAFGVTHWTSDLTSGATR
jgi:hypothetical protein